MKEINRKLGQIYEKLRKKHNLSQAELARKFGVSAACISKCEKTGKLSADMLNNYAVEFGVSTDYLLGRTIVQRPNQKIETICRSLGITEEAAAVLLDEDKRKNRVYAKEKVAALLKKKPADVDIEKDSVEYYDITYDIWEMDHRENARAMFLSALITDENFQALCEAYYSGYRKARWSHMLQHPDEYTEAGGRMDGQISEAETNRIAVEEAVQAKALYYDFVQYFLSFLNSAIPEPESPVKKKQSRRKAHAQKENQP
ncbi:MAG: helix-turn-helix domain-containing protein [Clostridiales bacterium]|nr:helix-turn-helix domain-containing protein [Clostridiales bacterium]MDY4007781.1 helix-turn-helix transcriptional regulator [Candidatus Limiplasma sp.]